MSIFSSLGKVKDEKTLPCENKIRELENGGALFKISFHLYV